VVQHAEVTPMAETFLVGLLAVALIAVLTRSLAYGWSQYRGYPGKYPHTWSAAQCRALEYFRVLVGVGLLPMWGYFVFLVPFMPVSSSSGMLQLISLTVLILVSYAWVLLLTPSNFGKFGALSHSFLLTILFLAIWWGAVFSVTGWVLAKASAPPRRLIFSVGAFAAAPLLAPRGRES